MRIRILTLICKVSVSRLNIVKCSTPKLQKVDFVYSFWSSKWNTLQFASWNSLQCASLQCASWNSSMSHGSSSGPIPAKNFEGFQLVQLQRGQKLCQMQKCIFSRKVEFVGAFLKVWRRHSKEEDFLCLWLENFHKDCKFFLKTFLLWF